MEDIMKSRLNRNDAFRALSKNDILWQMSLKKAAGIHKFCSEHNLLYILFLKASIRTNLKAQEGALLASHYCWSQSSGGALFAVA